MLEYNFSLAILIQLLDDDSCLAEGLFFPETSCYGTDRSSVLETLAKHARRLVEASPAALLSRRGGGTPESGTVSLVLQPPRNAVAWREPITLTFPVVRWSHRDESSIAFVPALGIEVVADSPEELERLLPQHVRAALQRTKAALSLRQLLWLQSGRRLEVEQVPCTAHLLSPKELAVKEQEAEQQQKSVLKEVATDLTSAPLEEGYELQEVVGRIAEHLTGRNPRSVLLVGPSGVGKTAAVHELVRRRAEHDLGHTPFWATSGSRLVAGMTGFGMWEERCQNVWREASRTKAILHLGNLVELMEVGKSELRGQGIASFLRPYIGRGDLLAVAECTPEQIPVIERQDPHLLGVFSQVQVEEPSVEKGRAILASYALGARSTGDLPIDPEALDTLDRLHRRYATYSAYPGRPLRFLKNLLSDQLTTARGDARDSLQAADITRAFARETGLPLFLLEDTARLDLTEARQRFAGRVIGQPEAVDLVVDLIATVKAGLTRPRKPIASLLFIGPTGVGKTEMAKALAEFLFGTSQRMTRLDMSEYADAGAVQRLIGGSFAAEGVLTARIREQPFSVVLLDEFEKAHPLFFDLLLQVLGEGRLTDAAGRLADFCNSVVIMTSNLGAESFQQGAFGLVRDAQMRGQARDHFEQEVRSFLRPELFNRIDRIVSFAPLDEATTLRIAERQLELIAQRDGIRYRGVNLEVTPEVTGWLARKGYDPRYGARPLKRAIERELLAPLAERMNRYAADSALDVQAEMEGDGLRLTVRARVDETGRQRVAGGLGANAAGLATECLTLRRDLQRLRRGAAMLEVQNEIYRLEKLQERLQARAYQAPEDLRSLGRLPDLQRIAHGVEALHQEVCTLEDQALLGFYGQAAFEAALLTAELASARKRWQELLLALYCLRFDNADDITLAMYGEQPARLFELAEAYYLVAIQGGAWAELWQLLPGRAGRETAQPDSWSLRDLTWRLHSSPADRDPDVGDVCYLMPARGDREPVPLLERRHVLRPAAFLTEPHDGTIGLLLRLRGPGVQPRFAPEAGLHVFDGPKEPGKCLVDTSDLRLAEYLPPEGIDRRGMIGMQERRRLYHPHRRLVEDLLLRRNLVWPGGALQEVLAEALEQRLVENVQALVSE